ncbi:hypothetical protein G6F42_015349 [Rhizopus arrhizus]|nr:hypothetical protein G6F42_015349 [Rhizopus arrhizus]
MTDKDNSLHIPNLHPDHRGTSPEGSPSQRAGYFQDPDAQLSQSFKDRIETFVGSYSRTSMMHMAENVMVSEGGMTDEEDDFDTTSVHSSYLPRYIS